MNENNKETKKLDKIIHNDEFKTINEQIAILRERGLQIDDEDYLKKHLKKFDYQKFIKGYNKFFLLNSDENKRKYKEKATSNGIISLFEFDRKISNFLYHHILEIERIITSSVSNVLGFKMKQLGFELGNLFKLDKEVINELFTSVQEYEGIKKTFNIFFLKEGLISKKIFQNIIVLN